jgi:hypothetical protein
MSDDRPLRSDRSAEQRLVYINVLQIPRISLTEINPTHESGFLYPTSGIDTSADPSAMDRV